MPVSKHRVNDTAAASEGLLGTTFPGWEVNSCEHTSEFLVDADKYESCVVEEEGISMLKEHLLLDFHTTR